MGRTPLEEEERVKESFLRNLKIPYTKIGRGLYNMDGKRVNVKLTKPRSSGRYWFGIQRNADSYVWICYNPEIYFWEAYYWVPAEEMWTIISIGSYRDRTWEEKGRQIPNFEIDPRLDLYIGGKNVKISIRRFRNLLNPL